MEKLVERVLYVFFTSLGMVLGGTLIGSISAVLTGHGPCRTMAELARDLKIWAAVAAIGGTITSLQVLESSLLEGQVNTGIKQLIYIFSSFAGAHLGYVLILILVGDRT